MNPVYAVVPAAGAGKRMGAAIPKQYLELAGRTVLEHTLARLAAHPRVARVVVAVSAGDEFYPALAPRLSPKVRDVVGGAERCHSVLAALDSLALVADLNDWVMVHDAARPCVRTADLDRMLAELEQHAVGGILAAPVRDTLKRCDADGAIVATVDRSALWHALTPQMFRLGMLRDAISAALADGVLVTDEAMAIERAGLVPRVVAGHTDNLKITHPEDLALAAAILAAQGPGEQA
ncbi:MAG: 2-C-methyl-D-erythritol 4-phosphate cytidylyltransferase [Gammaproteobacteria bacterium]